jgi:hypothetical protein
VRERGRTNRVKRTGDLTAKTGGEGVGSVALPRKEINRLQPNQGPFDHNIAHLCTAPYYLSVFSATRKKTIPRISLIFLLKIYSAKYDLNLNEKMK